MTDQLDIFTAIPEINENGVYDDSFSEMLSDEDRRGKHPYWGWSIRVVQFPDGLWRAAPRFMGPTSGSTWPLSIHIEGQPDRETAVLKAAETIHRWMEREVPTVLTRRVLSDMKNLGMSITNQEQAP